jgi:hypothetical protein
MASLSFTQKLLFRSPDNTSYLCAVNVLQCSSIEQQQQQHSAVMTAISSKSVSQSLPASAAYNHCNQHDAGYLILYEQHQSSSSVSLGKLYKQITPQTCTQHPTAVSSATVAACSTGCWTMHLLHPT